MRQELIKSRKKGYAKKICYWAKAFVKTVDGYMCFETYTQADVYKLHNRSKLVNDNRCK